MNSLPVIFDQTVLNILQLLATTIFAILFLQSGFDKLLHWAGNKAYIRSYFEKTPLKSVSAVLFVLITVLEVLAGLVCAAGVFVQATQGMKDISLAGLYLALWAIVALFAGQRIAKDYAGSANMMVYFIAAILSVLLFCFKA
jgi:putative oxidoreductase